ncbi:MAG: L-lactate permease [Anaerolineae bacterium]|nr:L-lactate permease [Anaerolineae bacterium]
MDYNTLDWGLALLPMLAVLGLMVGLSWNASKAGIVGLGLAVGLAALRFGAGAEAIGYAQVKALILTVDVMIIIWAALLLYAIVDRAGALVVIADSLASLTSDTLIQVLLLGWVLASFLQGVGGFGVPVAITAPLLIGLGVPTVRAAVIPALGHSWAVTFGSLAASFAMLMNVTGLPGKDLAQAPAIMLGVLCYLVGFMGAHMLAGWRGVRRSAPYVLVVGTAMSAAQYIAAVNGLWTIGAISGGLAGLIVSVVWIRFSAPAKDQKQLTAEENRPHPPAPSPQAERGSQVGEPNPVSTDGMLVKAEEKSGKPKPSVRLAWSGYVILVMLALLLRGIAPVKEFLGQWAVEVDIPATITDRDWAVERDDDAGFGIPGHPGLVILYSSLVAYWLFRRAGLYEPGAEWAMIKRANKSAWKSGIGVFMMVAVAATMARAGMMQILADGLSEAVPGDLYAFIAPVIGALGAFVTGSNVNSNAVFGELQMNTASLLGLSTFAILGAQTAAAAVISVMSPAKVTVGCSTIGANEGEVMRWLLGYGMVMVLAVGIMTWIGVTVL